MAVLIDRKGQFCESNFQEIGICLWSASEMDREHKEAQKRVAVHNHKQSSTRGYDAPAPLYTRSVPIHDLNSETLSLKEPIQVEIEVYGEETLAKVVELELWASENTESEALVSIKSAICELWNELREMNDQPMGRLPRMWKRILDRKIQKDATVQLLKG
jgi:hypothetical protein